MHHINEVVLTVLVLLPLKVLAYKVDEALLQIRLQLGVLVKIKIKQNEQQVCLISCFRSSHQTPQPRNKCVPFNVCIITQ
jgi:hypothetical protein